MGSAMQLAERADALAGHSPCVLFSRATGDWWGMLFRRIRRWPDLRRRVLHWLAEEDGIGFSPVLSASVRLGRVRMGFGAV